MKTVAETWDHMAEDSERRLALAEIESHRWDSKCNRRTSGLRRDLAFSDPGRQ